MITVKVTFHDGTGFTTEFNGTAHEALDHYWLKVFVFENDDGIETRRQVVQVNLKLISRVDV